MEVRQGQVARPFMRRRTGIDPFLRRCTRTGSPIYMEEVRLGKSHADVEVAAWQGSHPASNEVLGDWRGGNRSKLHEVLGDGGSKRGKVGRGFFSVNRYGRVCMGRWIEWNVLLCNQWQRRINTLKLHEDIANLTKTSYLWSRAVRTPP